MREGVSDIIFISFINVHKKLLDKEKNKDFSRGEPKQGENNGDALAMPIFMDVSAYEVKYDSNYEIKEIINYAQNEVTDDEIKQIAEQIL